MRMTVLAPLMAGASVIMLPRFDAAGSLRAIDEHRITWVPGVPTMFAAWGRQPGAACEGVRWALSAGAPLTEDICLRAEARLGCRVRQGYGLTEATFTSIDAPPHPRVIATVQILLNLLHVGVAVGRIRRQATRDDSCQRSINIPALLMFVRHRTTLNCQAVPFQPFRQ